MSEEPAKVEEKEGTEEEKKQKIRLVRDPYVRIEE